MKKFVAVYVFGGLIDHVKEGDDLIKMVKEMRRFLTWVGFNYEVDDARIFEVHKDRSTEVYSYNELKDFEPGEVEAYISEGNEEYVSIFHKKSLEGRNYQILFDPSDKNCNDKNDGNEE